MPKAIFLACLMAVTLAGCAVFGGSADRALRRTPSFRAGYSDGCAAATAQTANPRDDKDSLAGEDRIYKRGYAMGYQSCQQRSTAPVGAPTGGLSNPGHP
ncbi:MAG TPA: hypothetical protein VLT91_08570 [Rhizomicrobium sp.]|nr:hypothetical protein [Rhizomicrobium sp.]